METEPSIRQWIESVCRRYSQILGYTLSYQSLDDATPPCSVSDPGPVGVTALDERWRMAINDGSQPAGVLRLCGRRDRRRDAKFLKACEAAELAAHLIERVVSAQSRFTHSPTWAKAGDSSQRIDPPHSGSTDKRADDNPSRDPKRDAELKVASRMLPPSPIVYTGRNGWCEFSGCTESVQGIGGDLLELIPLSNERVFIVLGDAAGHSIPAAIVMAHVRGALRTLIDCSPQQDRLPLGCAPHLVLDRINAVLHGIVRAHQFMTMVCGIVDGKHLTFEYANAGHPSPLLLRSGRIHRLESHGLVLGAVERTSYESSLLSLRPGDVLSFFSDGVTEAGSMDREHFGIARIEDVLRLRKWPSAAQLRSELWARMEHHLIGGHPQDDRTLAVLRIAGSCPPEMQHPHRMHHPGHSHRRAATERHDLAIVHPTQQGPLVRTRLPPPTAALSDDAVPLKSPHHRSDHHRRSRQCESGSM